MPLSEVSVLQGRLSGVDWAVIAAYLLLTTFIGARLAGKQSTIRDFFLGGRKLPWWAICGSMIATEISAVTFIAVPTISFAAGGNLTYLQLAIGAVLARVIIGVYFVPRYYEHEIYSPYDYMGRRLGERVKKIGTGLFFVGAILGQGARLYVTAFVLSVVTGLDLIPSIWIMGAFSVCWTLLGGMTTVIWTDVIQFCVLLLGAALTLWYSVTAVPGSWTDVLDSAAAAGKFDLLDLSTNPALPYTLWCGLLATPFLNLAALGTDQVMAQRMFCCRNQGDATKAIIVSSVGIGVALLMLCVGIALYSYFLHNPFAEGEVGLYESNNTYLLPIFIVRALPVGVRGIIIAAVFASAISTLDSTLAALAQTTLSAFIKLRPKKKRATKKDHRRDAGATSSLGTTGSLRERLSSEIGISKVLVVAWGAVLCLMATACIAIAGQYANAVDLALALVGYTYGPMLGIFLLAFFRFDRDDSGLFWAVPMSMLAIFGMAQHGLIVDLPGSLPAVSLADWIVWVGVGAVLVLGVRKAGSEPTRVATVVAGALAIVLLHQYRAGAHGQPTYIAFTWSYPIGAIMTFALGYCLGRPKGTRRLRIDD